MTGPARAPAPFYQDVALGPEGTQAWWLTTADGVRIRMALWPLKDARGTVLMFPGRTEYVEKYGWLAQDFHNAGYAMAAVDWRGQGLADRALSPRDLGHVDRFSDYQRDVAAVIGALSELTDAPRPWHLVAHSMGGAIGLRAVHEGLDVARVVFSAPMWGIAMSGLGRLTARVLGQIARPLGLDEVFVPSTGRAKPGDFSTNRLTTDRAQFEYMEYQTARYPDLALGGPSVRWLTTALRDTAALMDMPAPAKPALGFLGTSERIVAPDAIRDRFASWPGAELEVLEGAEHEVLMEAPAIRQAVLAKTLAWFDRA